jgi:predicted PurR-regulated permease PerM
VFVGCLLVDNIVDKAIKPRYMQEGLDLSILVIILSILFWSWVLGPTGAILSVPLTMMVKKLVLESSEETRFIALLMGAGNTEKVTTNHSASEDENG